MNRVDRLMGILTLLQSQKFVMAEKVAAKFGISVRTVYRDIRALEEIGIPVYFENNRGYAVAQGYFLPPVSFSSHEANALILVASLADRFTDGTVARHSDNALQKIRAVLRPAEKEKSELLTSKIKVLNPRGTENNFLSDIQEAISSRLMLTFDYTDAKGQKTHREVEPIGMIYYTDQWHMIAWCWGRNDYRDFITKQIRGIRITDKPFRKQNHVTLEEHIRSWK